MRIALATDIYLPQLSGVADSVDSLARTLIARGHAVRVYAPDLPGAAADPKVCRRPAWTVPGSGGGLAVVSPFGMLPDLRRFAPDLVHTHTFSTVGLAALAAARRLRVPIVGTDHTFPADYLHYLRLDFAPFRYAVRRLAALYYERCAHVTGPSRSVLTELEAYGLSRPSSVVSNPIPADVFRPCADKPALKARLGLRAPTVLLFGRIAVEKNLEVALEVFARAASGAEAVLAVVGDGPHREAFAARAAALGLGERVRMFGVLRGAELVDTLNACDVYLTTSLSDTQSMTMLQAMACGLPVVAARAGGLVEYVEDGRSGVLVDPKDTEGFARALGELLADPERRGRMGLAARADTGRYGPDNVARRFEAIYAAATAGVEPCFTSDRF